MSAPQLGAVGESRWKCLCAYDGRDFEGWQSQAGGRGIQDVIEVALQQLLGSPVRIHGSGRTDAGVHARGQVFHFDACWTHGSERLLAALRTKLPSSIQVRNAEAVSKDFHARFSATGKIYRYQLTRGDADPFIRPFSWCVFRPLDLELMREAAEALCGRHDFRAFSAFNGVEREDTVRELRVLSLEEKGEHLWITAQADGFLYKMVRSLVGALVSAAQGKLGRERLAALLQGATRTAEIQTAPPQGLFLEKVFYPAPWDKVADFLNKDL